MNRLATLGFVAVLALLTAGDLLAQDGQKPRLGISIDNRGVSVDEVVFHVEPIDTVHVPFDPVIHEAMMQEPSNHHPAGTVLRVVQKGYRLHDRVIRAAKVIVSAASTADTDSESPADSPAKSSPA